jgi:hypothetical protein
VKSELKEDIEMGMDWLVGERVETDKVPVYAQPVPAPVQEVITAGMISKGVFFGLLYFGLFCGAVSLVIACIMVVIAHGRM